MRSSMRSRVKILAVALLAMGLLCPVRSNALPAWLPLLGYGAFGGAVVGASKIFKHYTERREPRAANVNQNQQVDNQDQNPQPHVNYDSKYYAASLGRNIICGALGGQIFDAAVGFALALIVVADPSLYPALALCKISTSAQAFINGMIVSYLFGHSPK